VLVVDELGYPAERPDLRHWIFQVVSCGIGTSRVFKALQPRSAGIPSATFRVAEQDRCRSAADACTACTTEGAVKEEAKREEGAHP